MTHRFLTSKLIRQIEAIAYDVGFDRVGFSQCSALPNLPNAKSVVSLGVGYFQGAVPPKPGPGYGRVARYAWGLDYHSVIFEKLQVLAGRLRFELGLEGVLKIGTDAVPFLEKPMADKAKVGFIGKHSLLITSVSSSPSIIMDPLGSWCFLAEVVLDIPIASESQPNKESENCGVCQCCQNACPQKALSEPYQLNAKTCISFLTIENKGWIPREFRKAIGDWIFGCDICQDICPKNSEARLSRWPEFLPENGPGPWLSLQEILSIPDQASFKQRWEATSLMRAKRAGLVRNACVVAGNSGDLNLVPVLTHLLNDPEPMIRGHAVWGLGELLTSAQKKSLSAQYLKSETDDRVISEWAWAEETCS